MGSNTKIYVQQTALRIELICNIDITGCLERKIKFKKPSGITGEWNATSSNDTLGYIYYDIIDTNDLDEAGTWVLWSWIKFPDNRYAPGDPVKLEVWEEGSI